MEKYKGPDGPGVYIKEVSYGSEASRPACAVSHIDCYRPTDEEMKVICSRIVVDLTNEMSGLGMHRNEFKEIGASVYRQCRKGHYDDESESNDEQSGSDKEDWPNATASLATRSTYSEIDLKSHFPTSNLRARRAIRKKATLYRVGETLVHDISGVIEGSRSYYSRYSSCLRRYMISGLRSDLRSLREEILASTRTKNGLMRNRLNKCRVSGFCRAVISVSFTNFERTITIPNHIASQTLVPFKHEGKWSFRTVKSGDWCVVVRNPTLDQRATQPWIVKIEGMGSDVTNPYSIKLPSSQTANLAADFDGDTCSMWFLSDTDSLWEAKGWKMDIESKVTPRYLRDLTHRKYRWTGGPSGCYRLTTLDHETIMTMDKRDVESHRTFRQMGLKSSHIDSYKAVVNSSLRPKQIYDRCLVVLENSIVKSKAKSDVGHISRMGKTIASMFFDISPGVTHTLIGGGAKYFVDPRITNPLRRGSRYIRIMSSLLRGAMQTALKSKMLGGTHAHDPMRDVLLGTEKSTIIMYKSGSIEMIRKSAISRLTIAKVRGSYCPSVISRLKGHAKYCVCLEGAKMLYRITGCRSSRSELEAMVSMMLTIRDASGILSKGNRARLGTWYDWLIHYYRTPSRSDVQFLPSGSALFCVMFPSSTPEYNPSPLISYRPNYGQIRYEKDLDLT